MYRRIRRLLLQQEQDSFVGSLSKSCLTVASKLFGDLMILADKSFTQWLPVPVTGITVPAGAPYNPLTTNLQWCDVRRPRRSQAVLQHTEGAATDVGRAATLGSGWTWETGVDLQPEQPAAKAGPT